MHSSGLVKGFTAARNLALAALVSAPAWGAIPAHPGMVNYVEGQASVNGQPITSKQVGAAEVERGQTIETTAGKAEVLLTPGVFLRMGDHSAVRFDSAGLTNTQVDVLHGKAFVEADDLREHNNIRITDRNAVTTLEKNGLYAFDADNGTVKVLDGKAQVQENDKTIDLKKGRMTDVSALKAQKFDVKNDADDLYRWSDLRSHYLSEASAGSARTYLIGGGGWAGGGWYWNPYYSFYSYLPGDGFLYSPFGYGFFSPFGLRSYYYGGGGYYRGGTVVHAGDRTGTFGRSAGFRSTSSTITARPAASLGRASSFGGASHFGGARVGGGHR